MTAALTGLTGLDTYFEDFTIGEVTEHARGKTVTEMDNVLLTNLVLNTAQGHFNEHRMAETPFGHRITFGGITAAMIIGLASQDTSENSLQELGVDSIRFLAPVLHGDTVYAFSEVIDIVDEGREDAGIVVFRHYGVNHKDEVVFDGQRRVLIKKRRWWAER